MGNAGTPLISGHGAERDLRVGGGEAPSDARALAAALGAPGQQPTGCGIIITFD